MQNRALGQPHDPARTNWSLRMADSALQRYSLPDGQWHYKDGLLFYAIYQVWRKTGESKYWQRYKDYLERFIDPAGGINTYSLDEFNLDQINPGKLLFPLYRATGQERYHQAILLLREQLRRHPRTGEGGFWHKQIYPDQMWLDGIYMAAPFYAEYASVFAEQAAFDDIANQITLIEQHTCDPHSGLLYHAWDASRRQRWADPHTGCSPHFWSRAIGWYVMALVDVLDFFPEKHAARPALLRILQHTLSAVARVQDEPTGLWWQILDRGASPGNYLEASGTCMYIYAIAKGVRRGYLQRAWLETAARGFAGLLTHLVTVNGDGHIDLNGVCSSAGLGGDPYRDGSFEYYVSEPIATNDLHGVGAFILAAAEMEKAAQDSRASAPTEAI